jgi:DnaJ-domain-containing protein 1
MTRTRSTGIGRWDRFYATGAEVTPVRGCKWPGCEEIGEYRAPRSPSALRDYLWFCLEHVRQYNKQWDYFAGLDAAAIEEIRRRDTVWHRPTWPLGAPPGNGAEREERLRDPFGMFGGAHHEDARAHPCTPHDEALAELGLDHTASRVELKARYKELVKRHHPDANGGCKTSEERLKIINEAYTYLLNSKNH